MYNTANNGDSFIAITILEIIHLGKNYISKDQIPSHKGAAEWKTITAICFE